MSDAQRPITTFFQAPKRSRPFDSENIDNRPSKLSTPIYSIRDSNSSDSKTNGENLNIDSYNQVLSVTNFSVEDREILSIEYEDGILSTDEVSTFHPTQNTIETSKGRVFLWKNEYRKLFKWLEYDPVKGKAWCTYSSCKMYRILCKMTNRSSWGSTQMSRHWFEQHEKTKKHCNHGRKPGQNAVTKYTIPDKPTIQHSDMSIAIQIQTAWWLAKEDITIMKFGSLLKATLITHKYDSLIINYSSFLKY